MKLSPTDISLASAFAGSQPFEPVQSMVLFDVAITFPDGRLSCYKQSARDSNEAAVHGILKGNWGAKVSIAPARWFRIELVDYTLVEMVQDNADDPDLIAWLLAAQPGDSYDTMHSLKVDCVPWSAA